MKSAQGSRTRRFRVALLIAVVAPWLVVSGPSINRADAHLSSGYVNVWWQQSSTGVRIGHTVSPLNTSAAHTSMRYGYNPWNPTTPSHNFTHQVGDPLVMHAGGRATGGANGANRVYITAHSNLTAPTRAEVSRCSSGTKITRAAMRFTTAGTWYTGSGTVPSGQYDLRGFSAHEFGHALGFAGHFTSLCSSPLHTMCGGLGAATSAWRSLEVHDIHTVAPRYGGPGG